MLSGTLTRGVWGFRREHVRPDASSAGVWAETVRLDSWLRLAEANPAARTIRLPFILTHRRPDTEVAPPEALAEVVQQHIGRTALPAHLDKASFPLRVRFRMPLESQPMVSVVVPTAARSPHVTRCLSALLAKTAYASLQVVIVVSQDQPLSDQQTQILQPILRDARTKLVLLENTPFNYSKANNHGVLHADGEVICMMNDDVEPMRADWLQGMVGHLGDPNVGVVGAKLYYRNNRIQHAGIIMGLAGLAEHVNRMLPQGDCGYAGRACLNQEFSAVTGACLLVRRSVYQEVGGLDEAYPVAFNDVDFCLRIRERGWAIVLSAQTEMWHYESTSLGHHFSGERAAVKTFEMSRMLTRWHEVCQSDPFHNPNLSLQRGAEWELAFPPRVSRIYEPSR
jgi:GT2 family glycosyltransferase